MRHIQETKLDLRAANKSPVGSGSGNQETTTFVAKMNFLAKQHQRAANGAKRDTPSRSRIGEPLWQQAPSQPRSHTRHRSNQLVYSRAANKTVVGSGNQEIPRAVSRSLSGVRRIP